MCECVERVVGIACSDDPTRLCFQFPINYLVANVFHSLLHNKVRARLFKRNGRMNATAQPPFYGGARAKEEYE